MPVETVDPNATVILADRVRCGCGRSATGWCTGLHAMTNEEWNDMLTFDMGMNHAQGESHEILGNDSSGLDAADTGSQS